MAERVGLVIGADSSQFRRELQGAGREIEKLGRITAKGRKTGFFSTDEAKAYDQQIRRVRTSLGQVQSEYRRVSNEVRILEQEQQKLLQTGQKVTSQQKEQLAALKGHARASFQAMQSAQTQYQGITQERAGIGRGGALGGALGGVGRMLGPAALAIGAFKAGSWIKSQADEGLSVAMENQMQRMVSARMAGRDPGSRLWSEARREVELYGRSLGYTTAETHKLYQESLKASGALTPGVALRNLAMMRGFQMDPGTLFGYRAAARQAGAGADTPLQYLLQARKLGGVDRPLMAEFARSITSVLGATSESRERTRAATIPGLFGFMTRRLGGVFREAPGRTARLLGGLQGTITAPGGGEAGQAFIMRAMGLGRGVSYYDALMRAEKGITEPANIQRLVRRIRQEQPGSERMQALQLHRLSGGRIKLWQAERLMKADLSELGDKGKVEALLAREKGRGVDLAPEAVKARAAIPFVRRQIEMGERRAALRVALDPAYKAVFKVQTTVLQKIADSIGTISSIIKGISGVVMSIARFFGVGVPKNESPKRAKPGR